MVFKVFLKPPSRDNKLAMKQGDPFFLCDYTWHTTSIMEQVIPDSIIWISCHSSCQLFALFASFQRKLVPEVTMEVIYFISNIIKTRKLQRSKLKISGTTLVSALRQQITVLNVGFNTLKNNKPLLFWAVVQFPTCFCLFPLSCWIKREVWRSCCRQD